MRRKQPAFNVHFRRFVAEIDAIEAPRAQMEALKAGMKEARAFERFLGVKRKEVIRRLLSEEELSVSETARIAGTTTDVVKRALADPDEETREGFYEVVDYTPIERDLGSL